MESEMLLWEITLYYFIKNWFCFCLLCPLPTAPCPLHSDFAENVLPEFMKLKQRFQNQDVALSGKNYSSQGCRCFSPANKGLNFIGNLAVTLDAVV